MTSKTSPAFARKDPDRVSREPPVAMPAVATRHIHNGPTRRRLRSGN
jgi:hypothetical protein